MAKKIHSYEVEYASGILRNNGRQNTIIYSTKKLNEGKFIIAEHIDCGVFIARVVKDVTDESYYDKSSVEYRYLKDINLNDWIEEIDRKKRKEELEREMQSKFAELDKKKKYEYYAQFDDEFKKLFDEYSELNSKNVY
jgi:hypothetical protein